MRLHPSVSCIASLAAIALATPAFADPRRPDPGFIYVDVNNDSLYSATDGDIVIPATLITNNGSFDTAKAEGSYRPGCSAVSLVVPASQTVDTGSFPLSLKAGKNLVIAGHLIGPSMKLQAGYNANLTHAILDFKTIFSVCSGKDLTLDDAAITGSEAGSTLYAGANRNLYARATSVGHSANLLAGALVNLEACGTATFVDAGISAIDPDSQVVIEATGDIVMDGTPYDAATNPFGPGVTGLFSPGEVQVLAHGTSCSSAGPNITMTSAAITSGDTEIAASGNVTLSGLFDFSNGTVDVSAGRGVSGGNGTSIFAGTVGVSGTSFVTLDFASLFANIGTASLASSCGTVSANSANIQGATGVSLSGKYDVIALFTQFTADKYVKLLSSAGKVTATDSRIVTPFSSTGAAITAQGKGVVDISRANWSAPTSVLVKSTNYNVFALNATLSAASLAFYAGGGTINVTGAVLTGSTTYGPSGVQVIGP